MGTLPTGISCTLGARAIGGAGLIIAEATAVEPRGRISKEDLGLWDDSQIEPLRPVVTFCRELGATMAVQLAHAGRKAGTRVQGQWDDTSVAPSAVPFDEGWKPPHALSADEIPEVVGAFATAARRAIEAGYQAIEIHGAHGYLISSFMSPLANRRDDSYGGDIAARSRFACEVLQAVRAAIPTDAPLLIRISASDLDPAGNTVDDTAVAARLLSEAGADLIDVSSGGNTPGPGSSSTHTVEFSAAIRERAGVPAVTVGDIRDPHVADAIIREGRADLVALGRELLRDPFWPMRAARELGIERQWPAQYRQAEE